MASNKYVTQGYIEEIEHRLYNDLSILDFYIEEEDDFVLDTQAVAKLLKPEEQYVRLKENLSGIVVTNFGRVINFRTIRQLAVKFTSKSMIVYVSREKVDVEKIFKDNKWNYDLIELEQYYKKYKWKHTKF